MTDGWLLGDCALVRSVSFESLYNPGAGKFRTPGEGGGVVSGEDWLLEGRETVPFERVLESGPSVFGDRPAFKRLVCPGCGDTYQHTGSPQAVSTEDYGAGWGGRGPLLVVPVEGECGHSWEMCFGFHKGETFTFVRTPPREWTS